MHLFHNLKYLCQQANISLDQLATVTKIPKQRLQINKRYLPYPSDLLILSDYFGYTVDNLLRKNLAQPLEALKNKDLRLLILDVDGVLTDGGMYYSEAGEGDEFKKFYAKDGIGIIQLVKKGFPIGIISSGLNIGLIRRRAKLLGIQYVHAGPEPKEEVLQEWCKKLKIKPQNVIQFGDDINDLGIMNIVGLSVCPADASPTIIRTADLQMTKNGGKGCVREFIDEYLLPYLASRDESPK